MKTVKDVSTITGLSIRTLRYYDKIGLLKPTALTDGGYRLYDSSALEKLQQIMFFRELQFPLSTIKTIMETPDFNRAQALETQKFLLEKKRNRLNGIIELIDDVRKGINTMNFESFNEEDIKKIVDCTLNAMPKDYLEEQLEAFGGEEKYRAHLATSFHNNQAATDILKWYGGKENVLEMLFEAPPISTEEMVVQQDESAEIYKHLMEAKRTGNTHLEHTGIARLAENYKSLFHLNNAQSILLDFAKEYLTCDSLREAHDSQFGEGCAVYVAQAIYRYYGV